MKIEEYHKMHALESHYWWFQGRRKIILTLLDQKLKNRREEHVNILDIGCGTGMLMQDLGNRGRTVGLDFSPTALMYCKKRELENLARADAASIPVKGNAVDVVVALDIIEHVKNDSMLMSELFRVLKPGGFAIMSVPAHKRLWSEHDIALQHFRRYQKAEFRSLVENSGLIVEKYTYSMLTAFVPAFFFRNFKKLIPARPGREKTDEIPVPGPFNALLKKCLFLEANYLRRNNLALGLSLLCIAEKPAATRGNL